MKAGRITIDLSAGTSQFILDMEKAGAKLRDFGAGADSTRAKLRSVGAEANQAGRAFSELGSHGVTGVQATSGALRVLEGNMNNNLRAAERFIANFLGLGPALQKIFPLVGGIAMIGIFDHLIEQASKLYKDWQKLQDAPQRITEEFRKVSTSIEVQNDQLRISNDRLENEIAKLSGKPGNGLKLALDEARLAADKLGESLAKDFEELNKLLKENNVSLFDRFVGGQARTSDIQDQVKKLGYAVENAQFEGAQKVKAIPPGPNAAAEAERINAETEKTVDAIRQGGIKKLRAELEAAQAIEKARKQPPTSIAPIIAGQALTGAPFVDTTHHLSQTERIAQLEGAIRILEAQSERAPLEDKNAKLQGEKEKLQAANDAAALTRPYQDKLHELDAQLAGLKQELASIGKSGTAEVLAKSWAEAQQSIARLNDELAKHHQALTLNQQLELVTRYDEIEAAKAEEEWRKKFEQTTTSVQDRIAALRLLTAAIGEGYEAQKKAAVEDQVAKTIGKNAFDPEWVRTHQADIANLRSQVGAEYDAQRSEQTAKTLDQLDDQIKLENKLADAEAKGAEAVREATLAYKLDQIAKDNSAESAKKLTDAEKDLANAQEKRKAAATLAQLQQEIDATNRLTAAQVGGAEAVRKAELENRIEQIKREVPADVLNPNTGVSLQQEQITAVTQLSEAQRQQQLVTEALSKGNSYQNRLDEIDQEVAALQQIKATQGDTLAVEISLRELEKERAKVWSDQVQVLGTARDGLKAYFAEMATDGVSAAQQVHDALKTTFDSLNENLAKLVSGQKVNWASLFQSISSNLIKANLRNIEANIAAKFQPHLAQTGSSGVSAGVQPHGALGNIASVLFGGGGSQSLTKRDGNTPETALFVTSVNPQTAANPAPNVPASVPSSPFSTPPFLTPDQAKSAASNIFSDIFGGHRASGGDVSAGTPYVVGESGQELFVPDQDGTIIPNHKLGELAASGSQESKQTHSLISSLGLQAEETGTVMSAPLLALLGAARKRVSPVGATEYVLPKGGALEKQLGALTSDGTSYYFEDNDTPDIRAHERIHQVQQRLGSQPSFEQLVTALAPAFHGDKSKTQDYIYSSGVHDGGTTPEQVRRDAVFEAPATLFSKPQLEGEDTVAESPDQLAAYKNYLQLLRSLNPKQDIGLQKVVPPELRDALKNIDGFRASGGDVSEDSRYIVGENGPELFVPYSGAFDNTKSSLTVAGLSRPTPQHRWLSIFAGMIGGASKWLTGGTKGQPQDRGIPTWDPGTGKEVYHGVPTWDPATNTEVYPDGTVAPTVDVSDGNGILQGFGGAGGIARTGISVGLGLLARLLDRPKNHHFQPGQPFYLPTWNDSGGSSFGGFRAQGGPVDPGFSYLVGEQQPEMFTPRTAGTITPLSDLQGAGSGGTNYYIDARGADPQAVEQRVRQASAFTYQGSVRTSFKARQEWEQRTPEKSKSK